jgi:hypothetical protein
MKIGGVGKESEKMDDLISRQAAIKEAYKIVIDGDAYEVVQVETLMGLPSVEPTLYGYKIEHLACIAQVLEKEGITAEDAARTFDDLVRAVSWAIDEALQKLEEAVRT